MLKTTITATATLALMALPVLAEGDAAKGERVFNKCKSCHAVGDKAKNKVGPILNGIVGAEAGQVEGFKYSDALLAMAADGLVWDEEALTAYLTKPKDFIDGTKMSFAGLRKDEDIANVIAYLATYE
ncbi:cytochrome c family protein [Rhodobacteraceae bacterium CCMM004]|nr:cytochrome c family protein [Rhodobacteraceae bacterium CCMM004]